MDGQQLKEYEADDLASNSDDERRLYRSEKRARRSKRRGHFVRQNQLPHQMQSAPMTAANSQFRQTNINKFGPCFKISISDYACFFVFKPKSEMLSLNNATFSNFFGLRFVYVISDNMQIYSMVYTNSCLFSWFTSLMSDN